MAVADDRCLCGCMHVKTGTYIVAVLELAAVLLNILVGSVIIAKPHEDFVKQTRIIGSILIVLSVIWLVLIILLLVGLSKMKASYILPHLIVTMIYWLVSVLNIIYLILNGYTNSLYNLLILFLMLYLIWVEYRCYLWVKQQTTNVVQEVTNVNNTPVANVE